jgi:hypothetical protein
MLSVDDVRRKAALHADAAERASGTNDERAGDTPAAVALCSRIVALQTEVDAARASEARIRASGASNANACAQLGALSDSIAALCQDANAAKAELASERNEQAPFAARTVEELRANEIHLVRAIDVATRKISDCDSEWLAVCGGASYCCIAAEVERGDEQNRIYARKLVELDRIELERKEAREEVRRGAAALERVRHACPPLAPRDV